MVKKYVGVFCLQAGCKKVASKNHRCDDHQLPAFSTNYRTERLPDNWAQLRETVLRRDKGVCYLCGEYGADAVDHIENNDNNELSNLKAVHHNVRNSQGLQCHRQKTSWEGWKGKQQKRPATYGSDLEARLLEWVRKKDNPTNE